MKGETSLAAHGLQKLDDKQCIQKGDKLELNTSDSGTGLQAEGLNSLCGLHMPSYTAQEAKLWIKVHQTMSIKPGNTSHKY